MGYFKVRFGRVGKLWACAAPRGGSGLCSLRSDPAGAGDAALKVLLKKGIITQQEYDEALKEAEQAPAAPVEAKPMTQTKQDAAAPPTSPPLPSGKADASKSSTDSDNTVDLGKGITFGYDRGLYTQFKDKFRLKIRIRLQPRFTDGHFNGAWNTIGDAKNYSNVSGTGAISAFKHGEESWMTSGCIAPGSCSRASPLRRTSIISSNSATTRRRDHPKRGHAIDDSIVRCLPHAEAAVVGEPANRSVPDPLWTPGIYVLSAVQFVDRRFVAEAFVPNAIDRRDQGVTFFSDYNKYPFNYALGVFNGVGINLTRLGLSTPSQCQRTHVYGTSGMGHLGKAGLSRRRLGVFSDAATRHRCKLRLQRRPSDQHHRRRQQ